MDTKEFTKDVQEACSTVPCGMVEFSGGEDSRITYISKSMLCLMHYRESFEGDLKILRQSIFTMIAPACRAAFAEALNKTCKSENSSVHAMSDEALPERPQIFPQTVEITCFDGNTISCLFWLETGEKTVKAFFVEVTPWIKKNRAEENERYIKVLSEFYSDIFEFDFSIHTVKAVYSQRSAMLRWIKDIPMQMEEATKKWILHKVQSEDEIQKLKNFWAEEPSRRLEGQNASVSSASEKQTQKNDPLRIHYHVMSSDGTVWRYLGVFVQGSKNTWLFCCRKDPEYLEALTEPYNGPKVMIRTFGYFDVFIGDTPVAFRNEKSKELLALLVDRKGGYVSADEAISFLWEDSPADSVTLARYRKVALRLKRTLEEYGISEIIESVNGKRRIAAERVQCDLYDYLSGKPEYSSLFKGSYLTNYSWAENTLAELL